MKTILKISVTLNASGWKINRKEIEVEETEKTYKTKGFRVLKKDIDVITDGIFRRRHNHYYRECYTENERKMVAKMKKDIKAEFAEKENEIIKISQWI